MNEEKEKIEIPNFPHETHIYNIQRNNDEKKTGNCVITITGAHGVVGDFINEIMEKAEERMNENNEFDWVSITKEFDSTKKEYWP